MFCLFFIVGSNIPIFFLSIFLLFHVYSCLFLSFFLFIFLFFTWAHNLLLEIVTEQPRCQQAASLSLSPIKKFASSLISSFICFIFSSRFGFTFSFSFSPHLSFYTLFNCIFFWPIVFGDICAIEKKKTHSPFGRHVISWLDVPSKSGPLMPVPFRIPCQRRSRNYRCSLHSYQLRFR